MTDPELADAAQFELDARLKHRPDDAEDIALWTGIRDLLSTGQADGALSRDAMLKAGQKARDARRAALERAAAHVLLLDQVNKILLHQVFPESVP
jgi:hypothetical protein